MQKEEKVDEKSVKKNRFSLSVYTKTEKIKAIIYIVVFVATIIVKSCVTDLSVQVGDFGSFFPLLIKIIGIMGLKWLPIFSAVGILLIILKDKFAEISKAYFIIVVILTITSTTFLFLV